MIDLSEIDCQARATMMWRKTNRIVATLFGGIGLAAFALAQSPGTFTPTGNLSTPRTFHTATLLTNGKVLIAGGYWNLPTLASAEIYDPSSGSFMATGDMTAARHLHTATLLPNGKVLLAGGRFQNGGPGQASAELYDPATATFSSTGSMTIPRCFHTATLLNNGKVLIAGDGSALQTAELYDPSTGTFSPTGNMTEPGAETATLLPNGSVLITRSVLSGQQRGNDQIFKPNHAELYDPATGTFTRTGDIIEQNIGERPTAMLLTNGKVLIAGGSLGDLGSSTSAEIYDPATGAFSATGEMTAGIDTWAGAVLLPEGKVLITGEGYNGFACDITHIGPPITVTCPGAAELYDPASGTFSPPIVSQSIEGHATTLLPDGTVLLSGGWVCCGITIATAEIYHPGVLVPAPQLFSVSGDGKGQGAFWNGVTGQIVTPGNPVAAGDVLSMYTTSLVDGSVIPPQVAIGGQLAEVMYFGPAPGYPGYNQVNVRVPSGVAPGPTVPVRLNYLGRPSNEVTLAAQ